MKKKRYRISVLVVAFVLVVGTVIPGMMVFGESESFEDGDTVALAYADSDEELEELSEYGDIIDHYGRNVLIKTTERGEQELETKYDIRNLDHRNELIVKDYEFDTNEGLPEIDDDLKIDAYEPGTEGVYLVDLIGPVNSEWVERLEEKGVEVMNYVPNFAYRVRMTPELADEVEDFEFVDWVGIYQPQFKLQSDLEPGMAEIGLASGAEYETIEKIGEIAGIETSVDRLSEAELGADLEPEIYTPDKNTEKKERTDADSASTLAQVELSDGESRVRTEIDSKEDLHEIARMNDVYYISEYVEPELHEVESQLTGGGLWFMEDDDTERNEPYRKHGDHGAYINQIGYTGDGVTITIADTGIGDGEVGDAGHPDFTGRVIGGYSWDYGEDEWQDPHYHGTHCAGLAAGDTYDGTEETYAGAETGPYYLAQGLASSSDLYSARMLDDTGGWAGPDDYFEIVEVPAQESDTYVHSNSWGADTDGLYTIRDHDYDAAVRDADRDTTENEPMVITASAGNAGPEYQTIGSPGNAKNVITVGAAHTWYPDGAEYGGANRDNPENIIGYSSRGWTADNRIKPDVVAPADLTLSTQTPETDGNYDPNSEQYRWMGGTSSSNPVVAGAAAVVVEWYEEKFGERPSPAMVRSLLINTAIELDDEVGNTEGSIPNRDEGWGMIDLTKLEYPHDDPIPFYMEDQENIFDDSGQVHEYDIEYEDPTEPLKITLGWTDKEAPAGTGDGPSLINDLNLEVESPGGQVYRGNAFEGGWSQPNEDAMEIFDRTGDGWDDTNNVENVYIPSEEMESGVYTVRVEGYNIAEDAVGTGENSQDYALTAYNAGEGVEVDNPPSVDIQRPVGGETWEGHTQEDIEWDVTEKGYPVDYVNLFYTVDGWESQGLIAGDLDPDTESYTWTVPNKGFEEDTDEAQVRVVAVDEEGGSGQDTSDDFTLEGIPPEPPENLLVEYDYYAEETIFYDDVSEDEGYTTGSSSEGVNEWDIREHGSVVGDQSWDWGDEEYEQVGEVSWLISPEIEIPEDARSAESTFHHWRDLDYEYGPYDGVNLKVSTESADPGGEWHLIEDPEPGYDEEIITGMDNPLGGEPAWTDSSDWEGVTVDLSDYAGESIYLRWDAGVMDFENTGEGWRIDDIEVTANIPVEDPVSNRLRWYASPDEDIDEVSRYNIYRAEDSEGPWDHIDSVYADGSEKYDYLDYDSAGDPYNWYVVRAVGENELEEDNEDAKAEPGDPDVDGPDITIDVPHSGSVWNAYEDETIQWTTEAGDADIDYIDRLLYSTDAGETWTEIDEILEDDGDYEWTVQNWPSEEAMIQARVVDEDGFWAESTSEEFEIVGQGPEPAKNLDVQHADTMEEWHWMYDAEHRASADSALGYSAPTTWYGAIRTELPEGRVTDLAAFEWHEPDHVQGYIHADEVDEPGEKLGETEVYDGEGGEQWREAPLKEPIRIEGGHYWVVIEVGDPGDGFFPLGIIEPFVEDGGWESSDGETWDETLAQYDYTWAIEAHVEEIDETGTEHNLLTWDASEDDPADGRPEEVSHYDVYRAETDWEDAEHIDTVNADGSDDYIYLDEDKGLADDIFWWYNVTAIAHNEMETEHAEAVNEIEEIQDWHDLNDVRNDLGSEYILVNDLDETTPGYEEYNTDPENYEVEEDAGYEETWDDGDTIDIPFDEDDYDSVLSVEDEHGDSISHTVDHPTITIEENTGERYVYVTYENTVVGWEPIGDFGNEFTGTFDGNDHEISDLYINRHEEISVGLFGCIDGAEVTDVGLVDAYVSGDSDVGGLIGANDGTVSNSYVTGEVSGTSAVGGLVGSNGWDGTVVNSHYNIDTLEINGGHHVTIGGLFYDQYQDWIEDKKLDIADYSDTLVPSDGHYEISCVGGLRDLLGFAGYEEYKFRLTENIDLSDEPGLHIPYLRADFYGYGHTISNLSVDMPFSTSIGMFGQIRGGTVDKLNIVDADVSGESRYVGGIVGYNREGTVSNSYATGEVSGDSSVGGLIGYSGEGTVSNSYATSKVSGEGWYVGALVGENGMESTVSNSYATGEVSGDSAVGGLVGFNAGPVSHSYATGEVSGTGDWIGGLVGYNIDSVENSYADEDTTGQTDLVGENFGDVTDSGMRTTEEMQSRTTFTEEDWDFDDTWWMVDGETYPLLRWQDVQMVIYPEESNIEVKGSEAYTAFLYNELGEEIEEVTGETTWSDNVEPEGASSWEQNEITVEEVGEWEITGEVEINGETLTSTAILTVDPPAADDFDVSVDDITAGDEALVNITDAVDEEGNELEGEYVAEITVENEGETYSNETTLEFVDGEAQYETQGLTTELGEYTATVEIDETTDFDSFAIMPGEAAEFVFVEQPKEVIAGEEVDFEIEAQDEFGNLDPDYDETALISTDLNDDIEEEEVNFGTGAATFITSDLVTAVEDQTLTVVEGDIEGTSEEFDVVSGDAHDLNFSVDDITAGDEALVNITDAVDEEGNELEGEYVAEITVENEGETYSNEPTLEFVDGEADYETHGLTTELGEYTAAVEIDEVSDTDTFEIMPEEVEYALTIDTEGEGSVTVEWDNHTEVVDDSDTFHIAEGTEVNLTAEADDDWVFVEWEDTDETGEKITITMDSEKELTARFEEVEQPYFEVEIIDYDEEIEVGRYVMVEFVVENIGDVKGTQDITFSVEGSREDTKEFTLEVGENRTGKFFWEAEMGSHLLTVESEDHEDTVAVHVQPEEGLMPGFTSTLLLLATVIAVVIYKKKKE